MSQSSVAVDDALQGWALQGWVARLQEAFDAIPAEQDSPQDDALNETLFTAWEAFRSEDEAFQSWLSSHRSALQGRAAQAQLQTLHALYQQLIQRSSQDRDRCYAHRAQQKRAQSGASAYQATSTLKT